MRRSERLSEIRAALAEVWSERGRRFASFEAVEDDALFVQWIDGALNLAWPFDAAPADVLPRRGGSLPSGVRVVAWTAHGTALLDTGDLRIDDTAALVARLLERTLDVDDVDVRVVDGL